MGTNLATLAVARSERHVRGGEPLPASAVASPGPVVRSRLDQVWSAGDLGCHARRPDPRTATPIAFAMPAKRAMSVEVRVTGFDAAIAASEVDAALVLATAGA